MKTFGVYCMICGAAFAFLALNMDVSVATEMYGQRVNNMGLIADRQNYLIVSISVVIVGVLMFIFGGSSSKSETVPVASHVGTRACPFCAELIKKEAIKCRHCGSEVRAFEEEAPDPGAFYEKPEDMPLGEYQEKFLERYGALRWANGYMWRGTNYNSFAELIAAVKALG